MTRLDVFVQGAVEIYTYVFLPGHKSCRPKVRKHELGEVFRLIPAVEVAIA